MATIEVNDRFVNVEQWHREASKTLVLLHGFTGTARSWGKLAKMLPDVHVIALDMVGHGASDIPQDASLYEMDIQLQLVHETLQQLGVKQFSLLGYSMGGRIALSYAERYPQHIDKLLLESASPGLMDEVQRMERRRADNELANLIGQQGIEAFVDKWENIPLFATQKLLPENIQQQIREERLHQSALGLANSLRGIGTGMMPSVWHKLNDLQMPVYLLVGELDEKFVNIAKQMKKSLQNAQITQFPGCGHAIHVENLAHFATIVKESISN